MGVLDKMGQAIGDAAKGAGNAASELGKGAERAAGDAWNGTVNSVKTAVGGAEHAVHDVAEGVKTASRDVADGAKHGDLIGGLNRAQQDVAAGAGKGLSDAWHGAADAVGEQLKGEMHALRDMGGATGRAYDKAVDGVARGAGDVGGRKAADAVRGAAKAIAQPIREQAKFDAGLIQGVGEGAGSMVRGIGDLVVGGVRFATDDKFRDDLVKKADHLAVGLGHLAQGAIKDPGAAASKLEHAAEGALNHLKKDGAAAAARGDLSEWIGKGVGRAGFEIASTVFVPESKGAEVANLAAHGAEALSDTGRVAGALDKAGDVAVAARGLDRVAAGGGDAARLAKGGEMGRLVETTAKGVKSAGAPTAVAESEQIASAASRGKLRTVLVDSGTGGAMTAALIDRPIRQLASYFCLPIGEKSTVQAANYTAAMILHPMLTPLREASGKASLDVAEHVIVACNTASVQVDAAIPLMEQFVKHVAENPAKYPMARAEKARAIELAKQLEKQPSYLRDRVHEIVTPTAHRGADAAVNALTKDGPAQNEFFLRVDSTNGTVESGSYPKLIGDRVIEGFTSKDYNLVQDLNNEQLTRPNLKFQTVAAGETKDTAGMYNVSHRVLQFEKDGETKTVFIENRGDSPWVDAIEGKDLGAPKSGALGDQLVEASNSASASAIGNLGRVWQDGFRAPPDLNLLSCTHYPAMQAFIEDVETGPRAFVNQAYVVRDELEKIEGKGAFQTLDDHLEVTSTIGSRAENGMQYLKTEGPFAGDVTRGTRDIAREGTIKSVIDRVRSVAGMNKPSEVKVFVPMKSEEKRFEQLHRFLGLEDKDAIMTEQGYTADVIPRADPAGGQISLTNVKRTDGLPPTGAVAEPLPVAVTDRVAQALEGPAGSRIDQLSKLITTGENRGVGVLATRIDNAKQLRASSSQLASVIERNKVVVEGGRKESVGIITGFQVIKNDTRVALGGENDGPPGAAVIAKMLVDHDTPASLITDKGSVESVYESLVHSNLATRNPAGEAGLIEDRYILDPMVKVRVADRDVGKAAYTSAIRKQLVDDNATTMISIERPSPNADGVMSNMSGQSIDAHNADFSGLLTHEGAYKPYTIGIGDGGNELGMGRLNKDIKSLRQPNLEPAVKNSTRIAADANITTNALILSSVSNTGGVALSMATKAALGEQGAGDAIKTYDTVIRNLFDSGHSIDGVRQENLLSVDGRPLGSEAESAARDLAPGSDGATHHDMFREMRAIFEGTP